MSGGRLLAVDIDGTEKLWREYPEIHLYDVDGNIREAGINELKNYEGGRKVVLYNVPLTLSLLDKHFIDGWCIFDDARTFADPKLSQPIINMTLRKKQRAVDIICTVQSFRECPVPFLEKATKYVIFNTDDHPATRAKVLRNYPEVLAKWESIQKRKAKTPRAMEIINIKNTQDEGKRWAELIVIIGSSMMGKSRLAKEIYLRSQTNLIAA